MSDIFRVRTTAEQKLSEGGFKDVRYYRQDDVEHLAMNTIFKKESYYVHEKRVPYATKWALNTLKTRLEELKREIEKRTLKGETDFKVELGINFDDFAGFKHFKFLKETPINENKLIDGLRQAVITGRYREYECQHTGARVSMQFEMRELNNETPEKVKAATGKEKEKE